MATLLVLHGPNLTLLGSREPGHYGLATLDSINRGLEETAAAAGHQLLAFQSNAEHALLERIHARESFRRHSYFSDVAVGVLSGLGPQVYQLALQAALQRLSTN